ncbi:hypothetical protein G7Y89_g478 [Cudoniella acicularis]|uniref:Zn(2)-C6 fungal-type domain-containing protein n=1 Tax=Cudoniella acicularis TaxID=354080 RepID=A0A8H4RX48_9HELO|nr:hypothetical protein G7Y89_g478 [Cudoniella acicularis]
MDTPSNRNSNGQKSNGPSDFPRDLISSFRTGTTKSRNGCTVCKIRRVKCDETKPHCIRCTSTGRNCEGYGKVPERKKSKSPPKVSLRHAPSLPRTCPRILCAPSVDVQGSVWERRSFHYLRSRNMSDTPGNFEPYFWDNISLQLSHKYPTILHALIALSAIYEEHERSGLEIISDTSRVQVSYTEYTLRQYNKAVKDLVEYLASDEPDPRVALTSCLIFVWIEFLQNDPSSGFRHLNCGLKILRNLQLSSPGEKARTHERDSEGILGSLNRSFTRLRIQAAIHGSQEADFTTSSTRELEILEPIPASFANIFESRNVLDKELNAIFGYIRGLREIGYYSSVDMLIFADIQRGHLERLQQWQTANKALVAALNSRRDQSQNSRILYLQLYYTLVGIIWRTMFAGSEIAFDAYTADFETMLTIVSSLINNSRSSMPPILSLDMGILIPLFFLCVKCRVLWIRNRAIALLKHAPEREGIWHRDSIVGYCEWKIMTEEQWRGEISEDHPLPEFARIYGEHIIEKGESSDKERPLQMRFRRGPAGLDIEDTIEMPDQVWLRQGKGGSVDDYIIDEEF